MRQLTIDPEFRDKIPPLLADEYARLEANILEDGEVREPIVVWGNTIIDGHNRYRIVQSHPEIAFKVKQMNFSNKWDAIAWMCRNQLGRRNLTDEQKSYLRGRQYDAEKMSVPNETGVNQYSELAGQNVRQPESRREQRDGTAGRIGKENGVDGRTIRRDSYFANGLDAAESVSPGIRESVLSGKVKAPKNLIAEIRNIPEEQRPAAVEAIKSGDTEKAKAIVRSHSAIQKADHAENPKESEKVNDTPAYNADDFLAALMAAVNAFDFSLDQHMVQVHLDILRTKEGRSAAEFALMKAKDVIKKYFRLIDGVVFEEDKNGKKD